MKPESRVLFILMDKKNKFCKYAVCLGQVSVFTFCVKHNRYFELRKLTVNYYNTLVFGVLWNHMQYVNLQAFCGLICLVTCVVNQVGN